jgi:hypothetical protein
VLNAVSLFLMLASAVLALTAAAAPYLIAEQQSKDMIDALSAARAALPLASATLTRDNGQLFITGYSQGGYVAMATDRAMQAAGMTVTAAAPMSGPYALAAFVDAVFYGEVNGGATISSTLLLTAYQHAYGNIYADPVDVFAQPYAAGIDTLLPTTATRSELYAQDELPANALFSLTPPAPAFAADTPPTTAAKRPAISTSTDTRRSVVADSNSELMVGQFLLVAGAHDLDEAGAIAAAALGFVKRLVDQADRAVERNVGRRTRHGEVRVADGNRAADQLSVPHTGSRRTACSSRSAVKSACAGVIGPSTARNSSPPQRTSLSFSRSAADRRWLMAASTASPAG